jgi:hypothetical protein
MPAEIPIFTVSEEPMPDHALPRSRWRVALDWVITHRRKILSTAILALPFVTRYVPGFPVDVIADALRAYLGS